MKTIFLTISCLSTSILIIFLLNWNYHNKINNKNGFTRYFAPHPVTKFHHLNIQSDAYYLSGVSSNHIYLGNFTNPTRVLRATFDLSDTSHITIPQEAIRSIEPNAPFHVDVDSSHLYLVDGSTSSFYYTTLSHDDKGVHRLDSIHFGQSIPLSPNSVILNTFDASSVRVLKKISFSPYNEKKITLEKLVDGIFCTDGIMQYDRDLNKLLYMYFYRNEFLCLDTNLNLLYKAKTIDTTNVPQIKIYQSSHPYHKETTLSAPPKLVNYEACISKENIYIHSALCADNQDPKEFSKSEVIDVYALKNGKYRFSCYLPKFNGYKLRSFKVHNNTGIALYGHYLVIFNLSI
jgi:hypothetical protein